MVGPDSLVHWCEACRVVREDQSQCGSLCLCVAYGTWAVLGQRGRTMQSIGHAGKVDSLVGMFERFVDCHYSGFRVVAARRGCMSSLALLSKVSRREIKDVVGLHVIDRLWMRAHVVVLLNTCACI
jgi:hypothetical protein